jgi:hypothetical protein
VQVCEVNFPHLRYGRRAVLIFEFAVNLRAGIVRAAGEGVGQFCLSRGRIKAMTGFLLGIALCCSSALAMGQMTKTAATGDSDADGLSDSLEETLLRQFAPRWMISRDDCSVRPARFEPMLAVPTVEADDGTVYGQAFPSRSRPGEIELHFYHLWRRDCGEMGHPLDAEHVAVLLREEDDRGAMHGWRAVYWYAAAHEGTVCDASQLTRASTLNAEEEGATVWISSGKHASFLNGELCQHGCGGDRCEDSEKVEMGEVVNLGELSHPAAGAAWVSSPEWPLAAKMRRSDFTEARVGILERLPATDIAWANPSKRPAQAAIFGGNSAVNGIATGGRNTDTALVLANDKTNGALGTAQKNTGNALTKSFRNVRKALGAAAEKTGKALGVGTEPH